MMQKHGFLRRLLICGLLLAVGVTAPTHKAAAHPHVIVEARAEILFNDKGEVMAVRHLWRFDEAFSSFAKQGLDKDGKYTRETLQPLAEVNVKSLSEFSYFTRMKTGGKRLEFGKPENYWIDHDDKDGTLVLQFTLALSAPLPVAAAPLMIEIGDPEYFVAFEMAKAKPVALLQARAGCEARVREPASLDSAAASQLSRLPSSVRQLPPELSGLTQSLFNVVIVTCS